MGNDEWDKGSYMKKETKSRIYYFDLINQWPELTKFKKWNWINFSPIRIEFEAGSYKGSYWEVIFIIMGFGFMFQSYNKASLNTFNERIEEIIAEIDAP